MPAEQKKQAKELLMSYKHKPKVEGLINYLDEDWSHLYDIFLEKTKIIDEVRKIR